MIGTLKRVKTVVSYELMADSVQVQKWFVQKLEVSVIQR